MPISLISGLSSARATHFCVGIGRAIRRLLSSRAISHTEMMETNRVRRCPARSMARTVAGLIFPCTPQANHSQMWVSSSREGSARTAGFYREIGFRSSIGFPDGLRHVHHIAEQGRLTCHVAEQWLAFRSGTLHSKQLGDRPATLGDDDRVVVVFHRINDFQAICLEFRRRYLHGISPCGHKQVVMLAEVVCKIHGRWIQRMRTCSILQQKAKCRVRHTHRLWYNNGACGAPYQIIVVFNANWIYR